MMKFNFVEKITILKDIIFSSTFLEISFLIFLIAMGVFLWNLKREDKRSKILPICIYIILIFIIFFKYGQPLFQLFDGFMDNIFSTIYFPTPVAYIIMFIITNIVMLKTIVSKKMSKAKKNFNVLAFSIISFLSYIILELIVKNNINIYSTIEIYTNTNLLVSIELAMVLFTVWMIVLTLIYIIEKITNRDVYNKNRPAIEKTSYLYDEPIVKTHFKAILPDTKEMHSWIENNKIIISNPNLYNENGSVRFPEKNKLQETFNIKQEEKIKTFKSLCEKDYFALDDYKQLKNVLQIAYDNEAIEESDWNKLISILN